MSEALTSLTDLADEANRNHQLAETTAGTALEYARLSGSALTEAKSQVPHGGWLQWLSLNFKGSSRVAQKYMQLSSNAHSYAHLDPASMAEALKVLTGEDGDNEEESPSTSTESTEDDGDSDELGDEPFIEEDEAQHVGVKGVEDEPEEEAQPECEPERGVGLVYARTALDALNKIPKRDPSRKKAIAMIADWLEANH